MKRDRQGDGPIPEESQKKAELLRYLRETMGADELHEFAQQLTTSDHGGNEQREEDSGDLKKFLKLLENAPAGFDLPVGFRESWEKLLSHHEAEAKRRRMDGLSSPSKVDALVKRGWITVDRPLFTLRHHLTEPSQEEHPVPVVLVSDYGNWSPTGALLWLVRLHPFIKAIGEEMGDLTAKERVEMWLKFAASKEESANHLELMLTTRAGMLEQIMLPDSDVYPGSYRWMCEARDLDQFWSIVQAAIELGKRWALWEVFADGELEALVQRALIGPAGKVADQWGKEVERLLGEFKRETADEPTPVRLVKWLGGTQGNTPKAPIKFKPDAKGRSLEGITWEGFQNRVKSARRRGF